MHDVTPNVVPTAVRIDNRSCKINFQVSFFMMILMLRPLPIPLPRKEKPIPNPSPREGGFRWL